MSIKPATPNHPGQVMNVPDAHFPNVAEHIVQTKTVGLLRAAHFFGLLPLDDSVSPLRISQKMFPLGLGWQGVVRHPRWRTVRFPHEKSVAEIHGILPAYILHRQARALYLARIGVCPHN